MLGVVGSGWRTQGVYAFSGHGSIKVPGRDIGSKSCALLR